ncbi:phage minor head protein [Catenovulum sediminis]|uniref:phage minor head protein n=1 Tax=Catenovulum sediminis TaxID=1740262 RepID=UPI00117DC3C0|nr:phage minor head protein [Catenovulum sediminis]
MPSAQYGSLPFKPAIAFYRNKLNLPSERWADVWKAQHNVAFTVAGATKTDLIADFRLAVDDAIANGKSLSWFKSEFKNIAKKHGWEYNGSPGWRSDVIYQTNMRQAYNAGRYEQLQNFEFWRYAHGDSLHPRQDHLFHDQRILPKTDPWWQVWFPQNGWGCKCKVFGESKRSLKRKGLTLSESPKIERYEWVDKKTGEVHQVPKGIDPGFDYSPGQTSHLKQVKKEVKKKPPLAERLPKRIVPSAFSTVRGVDAAGIDNLVKQLPDKQQKELADFLKQKQTKTVFVKQTEMGRGKASQKIAPDIAAYLGVDDFYARMQFTTRQPKYVGGFTSVGFEHVVVKVSAKNSLKKANMPGILKESEQVLERSQTNTGPAEFTVRNRPGKTYKLDWTISDAVERVDSDNSAVFVTWLHELGHQVHYYAGAPEFANTLSFVTKYGAVNKFESFAESFTAYMLAPAKLKNWQPELYEFIERSIQTAITSTEKKR